MYSLSWITWIGRIKRQETAVGLQTDMCEAFGCSDFDGCHFTIAASMQLRPVQPCCLPASECCQSCMQAAEESAAACRPSPGQARRHLLAHSLLHSPVMHNALSVLETGC